MRTARVHPHGGPKKLTDAQERVADELIERGVYVYADKVQGKSIVDAWRRYLQTGDSGKITEALYSFIHMKCGYIAHFNLTGFRSVYADPARMLEGELYANVWREGGQGGPVEHSASVYTDGLTDQDVYEQMVEIAETLRADIFARSSNEQRDSELRLAREIAAKYGYSLERNLE
jgi:hypothetical protein